MTPFFLTGLPRSRLAWLANLLTYGPSFCFHGALAGCQGIDELNTLLNSTPDGATQTGDADPLLGCVPTEFLRAFPDSKIVFVFRSYTDALADEMNAIKAAGLQLSGADLDAYFKSSQAGLDLLWDAIPTERKIWLPYHTLDHMEVVKMVWEFCLPGIHFPERRYEMLDMMRVTQMCSKVLAKYPDQPFRTMLEKGKNLCLAQ